MSDRPLTQGEKDLLDDFFGEGTINYTNVKIYNTKYKFWQPSDTAMAPNGNLYMPGDLHLNDYSAASLGDRALFVHEMSHVLQYQSSSSPLAYTAKAIRPALFGSYNYEAIFGINGNDPVPFNKLNNEMQAEFLHDLYILKSGGTPDLAVPKGKPLIVIRSLEGYEAVAPTIIEGTQEELTPKELNAIETEAGEEIDDEGSIRKPGGEDDDAETLDADHINEVLDKFEESTETPSPLILDIAGTGIDLTSLNSANAVYWKHDPNSDFAVASGWFTGGNGLLAIDLNQDGVINDSSELFGNQTGFANGFLALAELDSNEDNKITSADDEWENLRVWIDINMNGYSEADELYTLDELLITEINLNYSNVDYQIASNNVYQESTFTIDGQTRDIVDAYFKVSATNTLYDAHFTPDWAVTFLPNIRGYAGLPDFYIALSLDNDTEDADSLMSLMTALSESDYAALGVDGDPQQFYAAVEKVMLRWAGVDGVDPDSRGTAIDARYLEFVEKITGQEFTQLGGGPNPLAGPAPLIMEAFGTAHQAVAARLAYQLMDGHELFDDAPLYNPVTDTFGDSTGVDFDALETFLTHTDYLDHLAAARLAVSWTEEIIGFDNLTTQEVLDFEALLPQNVTLSALLADPQYSIGDAGGFLYGDANDNFMVTPLTLEENVPGFSAGAGNDLLITGPADQTVYAYDGNDTIIAGTERQMMYGYGGDDLYVFAPGMEANDNSGVIHSAAAA